jgi:molybdenum cofactor biosynthesis enzyme MoaA
MPNKRQIKKQVISKVNDLCKGKFKEIEFATEGSLTETYKYLSLKDVKIILDACFEETYGQMTKRKIIKVNHDRH